MINYIKIVIVILIELLTINIIIHYDFFKEKIKFKNNKIIKNILKIIRIVLILILLIILGFVCKEFYETKEINEEIQANFSEITLKINEEYEYYEKVKKDYNLEKKEAYIPEGFYHVEGNYENGFAIEDKNKNQYVWVPVSKEKNPIEKSNYIPSPFISYYECYDEEYKEFLQSVLQNGGFYISRFQIGKENESLVSKKNVEILKISSLNEAKEKVESMYKNNDFKCEIANGFAYDIALNWILKNNEVIIGENNKYTGNTSYQNIYDMIDDNFEITLEKSYSDAIIYRGFVKKESTAKTNYGVEDLNNRWALIEENEEFNNVGIRTIIYK